MFRPKIPPVIVVPPLPVVLIYALTIFGSSADAVAPPNVVLIISDDQGWTDYGFMGHPTVETPNLDQLSRRSLVLDRGYVVAPLCRPSLASIATGSYPHQHGVYANDVSPARRRARGRENRQVYERFHRIPSMARLFVEHGYLALQTGKWWEGSWQDGGFTHGMTHGDPDKGGRHGDEGLKIGREWMAPITDFIDEAVAQQKPFFVWYAPFLPHTPHNPPAELLRKYAAPNRPENVVKYFAMCDWFDQTCGELLDHLQRRELTDDTLIVYISDNGWAPVDPTSDVPTGWWPDFAPRSKGSPYETGIRTPIMISWPGRVAPRRSHGLASSIDLLPTMLAASRIEPPSGLPGINLLDEDARGSREAIFGASYAIHNMNPGDANSTLQYRWCIADKWKLLLRHHGQDTTRYRTVHEWDRSTVSLFDLGRDPLEQTNLAANESVVARLNRLLDAEIPPPQ